jgi:hypothetical protein
MALNNLEEDRAASRTEAVADLVQVGEVAGVEDFALDDGEVDFSVFFTGLPIGTCQDALDTACGLYLNDPLPGPETRRIYGRDRLVVK